MRTNSAAIIKKKITMSEIFYCLIFEFKSIDDLYRNIDKHIKQDEVNISCQKNSPILTPQRFVS